ncbi:hypothetical protein [Psychrobacter sp. KCTC 72983]|uniref:hypothetical protein n=1 Tax=Psychrobacter sp. KCTC 72983 TaxID=2733866 RepID=UPI00164901AD|nr:hypothetical protein [Psychrobacter sp. KCTC 72983]
MMTKPQEKLLVAVLLAILLHVGAFFIFYLNFDDNTNERAISKENVTEQITMPVQSDAYPPLKTQSYIAILDDAKVSIKDNKESQRSLETSSQITPIAVDNQTSNAKVDIDDRSTSTKNSKAVVRQTLGQNNSTAKVVLMEDNIIIANTDETAETTIKNAGLLARDVPIQNTGVEIDKDYQKMKSEVDDANDRLSDAINEVKKRNQQKIEARQQRKDSAESYIESNQPNNE